jgi:2-polyprenyl-3-methyl-5-hydroxy-6-metoxy-1,4-benzoquinol methylase
VHARGQQLEKEILRQRVDSYRPWHYEFDLDGVITPIYSQGSVNRHIQRRRIGFDPLVEVAGGSLRGRRVLDLGCNSGWWSLAALEAGADFVLGIDGRQLHIDQANLVFDAKGVDPTRYSVELGNIFEYPYEQQFDVVLCLGLMYHIAKPLELFEIFARVGASLVLIDTIVNLIPRSAFRVKRESIDSPRNAVDYETTLIPSRQAVIDLGSQFGYETAPLAQHITDRTGMHDYLTGARASFLCARGVSLDSVDRESMGQLALGLALGRQIIRRAAKRGMVALGR